MKIKLWILLISALMYAITAVIYGRNNRPVESVFFTVLMFMALFAMAKVMEE